MADILVDTASQANYNDVVTEHVAFDWSVDFNTKVVSGSATLDMIAKKDDLSEVMYVQLHRSLHPRIESALVLIHGILISRKSPLMELKLQ